LKNPVEYMRELLHKAMGSKAMGSE
jgi:hypothetical protein